MTGTVLSLPLDADKESAGIEGVDVSFAGTDYATTTDADGEFALDVPAGEYTLALSKDGYPSLDAPVTIERAASLGELYYVRSEAVTELSHVAGGDQDAVLSERPELSTLVTDLEGRGHSREMLARTTFSDGSAGILGVFSRQDGGVVYVIDAPAVEKSPLLMEIADGELTLRETPGSRYLTVGDQAATVSMSGATATVSLESDQSGGTAGTVAAGRGATARLRGAGPSDQDDLPPFGNEEHKQAFKDKAGQELDDRSIPGRLLSSGIKKLLAIGVAALVGGVAGALAAAVLGLVYFAYDLNSIAEDALEGVCEAAVRFYCEDMEGGDIFEREMDRGTYNDWKQTHERILALINQCIDQGRIESWNAVPC